MVAAVIPIITKVKKPKVLNTVKYNTIIYMIMMEV